MPYPESLVEPMREELTQLGIEELPDAASVDRAVERSKDETTLLVINTVCGCAGASARPAVALALNHRVQPDRYVTVFAGQDLEATNRMREHLVGIPPSSPFFALWKGGHPVHVMERRHIEGRDPAAIASDLVTAFDEYCGGEAPSGNGAERPEMAETSAADIPSTFRSIM